jgi:SulP family sulfate permease
MTTRRRGVAGGPPPPLNAISTASISGHSMSSGLTRQRATMLTAIQLPAQMATAHLAGLLPQFGFYAFIAGGIAFALFGANRFMSVAADSTIAPIFAAGLALAAVPGSPLYAQHAASFALMVGTILLLAGIFRMGWIADLVSISVTTGFLGGVAVHIVEGQLPVVLGLPALSGNLRERLLAIVCSLQEVHAASLLVGLGVLAIVLIGRRIGPRVPGALIGVALASLSVAALGLRRGGSRYWARFRLAYPAWRYRHLTLIRWASSPHSLGSSLWSAWCRRPR